MAHRTHRRHGSARRGRCRNARRLADRWCLDCNSYILRLDGLAWRVPGVVTPINSPFFGFDAKRNQEGTIYLFAASGTRVWASDDESLSWSDVSGVLPERPHNAELHLMSSVRQTWLYLSTFGRSVWRAPIHGFG